MTSREEVIAIRSSNPCATLNQMATKIGITRERVRQILKSAHLPTRHYSKKYLCIVCGSEIKSQGKIYCSRQCQHKDHSIELACAYCGLNFRRAISLVLKYSSRRAGMNDAGYFCSKKCFGAWLGEHYGFKAHAENCGPNNKWDYAVIDKLRLQGKSMSAIARDMNIPYITITSHYMNLRKKGVNKNFPKPNPQHIVPDRLLRLSNFERRLERAGFTIILAPNIKGLNPCPT